MSARRFALERFEDVTGVSGTGTIADGVQWPDGTVSIRWRGSTPSTVGWDSISDAMAVHGHQGRTRVVWVDAPDGTPTQKAQGPICGDRMPSEHLGEGRGETGPTGPHRACAAPGLGRTERCACGCLGLMHDPQRRCQLCAARAETTTGGRP